MAFMPRRRLMLMRITFTKNHILVDIFEIRIYSSNSVSAQKKMLLATEGENLLHIR